MGQKIIEGVFISTLQLKISLAVDSIRKYQIQKSIIRYNRYDWNEKVQKGGNQRLFSLLIPV